MNDQNIKKQKVAELYNVGLRYDDGPEVLKDINFSLSPGDFYFLTGESGAGKTSLLSLLYLANRPTRGNIRLFGSYLKETKRNDLPEMRRKIGVVFQNYRLLDHLSAYDNVALPLRAAGVSEAKIKQNVEELLAWVDLQNFMHAKPDTLSGGQKQRVAIARAVINGPDILIADEPTGNVDSKMASRLLYLFEEMNKQGTSVIIATHSDNLIEQFQYPRMHLENGKLQILNPVIKGTETNQSHDKGNKEKSFSDNPVPIKHNSSSSAGLAKTIGAVHRKSRLPNLTDDVIKSI